MSRDDAVYVLATPEVIDGEVVDDELSLPSDIAERVEALDALVAAMNRQIEASVRQLGDEYVHGWVALWVRWRRFVEALQHGPPSAGSSSAGGVRAREQVAEYEHRVGQWRREAELRGVRVVVPPRRSPRRTTSAASVGSDVGDDEPEGPADVAFALGLTALVVVAVVNELSS